MAKRKRKMTLFDVINSGQPIGLQVRQRVPTYQPTPELPVKKKLAKLFGRKSAKAAQRDPNLPLSAAEELELLRRELGGGKAAPAEVETFDSEPETEPTARYAEPEPERDTRDVQATAPRAPRKPLGTMLAEYWQVVSPRVHAMVSAIRRQSAAAWRATRKYLDSFRDLNTQHAATVATVIGGVIVLGGSFYVGKLLLQRPADPGLLSAEGINQTPRPEVMDVDGNNSAVANVSRSVPNVALERSNNPAPTTPTPKPTVFGGRSLDLNYVIIQSYYTQAEADAAVDVLGKYNIRCSVEKNLPGWGGSRDFYSVVSFDGYPKLRDNAAYQSFLATLGKISDRETGSTLPKRLDPRPYKFVRSGT